MCRARIPGIKRSGGKVRSARRDPGGSNPSASETQALQAIAVDEECFAVRAFRIDGEVPKIATETVRDLDGRAGARGSRLLAPLTVRGEICESGA